GRLPAPCPMAGPLTRAGRRCLRLRLAAGIGIDALLENRRRLEHHDTTRRDWHFLAGLRVTSDALPLLAHHERAERRQLHGLATLQTVGNFLQYKFYERSRLAAPQTDYLVDRLAQIGSRYSLSRHGQPRQVGDRSLPKTSIALNYQGYELVGAGSTGFRPTPRFVGRPPLRPGTLSLPADQCRAPGEPAAHGLEQQQVAALDAALGDRIG